MSTQNDGYYFVIFPKYLQTKGFVLDKKLPQYSISAFVGQCRVDQISMIPMKQQKLYHTIFWLTTGKIEFKQSLNLKNQQLVRLEVHDESELIGKVYLNIKEYIKQCEEEKEHYYCQKVKISDNYQMQFQLFMATQRSEIDNLLIQYHGQSDIRTPITKQSQDRNKDDSELNFDLLKMAQSQIYSPLGPEQKKSIFNKIDEEQSINSSVPQTHPINNRFAFKINLNQVEQKEVKEKEKLPIYDSGQIKRGHKLSLQQKITLFAFGGLSLLMIYFSMTPLKRI